MEAHSKFKLRPVAKRFLMSLIPLTALLGLVSIIVYQVDINGKKIIIKKKQSFYVDEIKQEILHDFGMVVSSLKFLSEQHELKRMLSGDSLEKGDLAGSYLSFAKQMGLFDQIRFLDETGMEVTRINYDDGNPFIVPENQLQFKGKRYYFKDTFRLGRGELFISPFDLNIEQGKLEQPLKPMIRFGTPIFDQAKKKRGVIILNYLGAKLLCRLNRISGLTAAHIMLLNADGYWLKGRNPREEWGFMYEDRKELNFGNSYPDAWQRMGDAEYGQFNNTNGIFTYASVYPLADTQKSSTGSGKANGASALQINGKEYSWKIVSHVAPEVMASSSCHALRMILLMNAVTFIVLVIGSFSLARAGILRKQTEEVLRLTQFSVDHAADAVFWMSSEARIIYVNNTMCSIMGYSREELLSLSIHDIDPGLSEGKWLEHRNKVKKHRSLTFESRYRTRGGAVFPVEISLNFMLFNGMEVNCVFARDISKRIRAEKDVRDSKQRLTQIVDFLPDATFVIDTDGRVQAWNRAMEEMTGIGSGEMLGKGDYEYAVPFYGEKRPILADLVRRWDENYAGKYQSIHKTGDTFFSERYHPLIGKKGAYLWATASLIYNGEGEVTGVIESIRDITSRKWAEDQLRKLSSAVEASPAIVIITDRNGTIEYVNPKFVEVNGYEAEEVMGQNPRLLGSGKKSPEFFSDMWNSILSGNVWKGEFINRKKSGELHWQSALVAPIRDSKGVITHFVSIQEDITDRKQAEENLKKLSQAVDQSPATVVITDPQGAIEYVNPKFVETTGYTSEEAIGQNPRILKSEKHSQEFYKELWDTITSGRQWHGEFENKKKSGELYWELATISPLRDSEGRTTHFVAVKEDISERKRKDEALKNRLNELADTRLAMLNMMEDLKNAKSEAEEATRAKSDFLANMSHEIRTPMNAIIGMTHLALRTRLNPKQSDYLRKVDKAAKSLLGIINDILDFSKIEAGKMTMESIEFNLGDVLDDLSSLIPVNAQEKGLEMLFNVDPEVPVSLVGDPLRLVQVLLNLTNNAVKFTDRGEIIVSVDLDEKMNDYVKLCFSIEDTGIGMTMAQAGRLFQPFTQVDASMTRKYGGTGLGLTISKCLVEMMNGEISVTSEPGTGSRFSFTAEFGLHSNGERDQWRCMEELKGKRVLVVDDSMAAREILEVMLRSMGFEVVVASTGREALGSIEKYEADRPVELVLMDWKMPGMDGIETSKRIKRNIELRIVPRIILVTAYGKEEIFQQAEFVGIDGFLLKPFIVSALFNVVMETFGQTVQKTGGREVSSRVDEEALKNIRGARILVAEDIEINQQVLREILENEGMVVTIVDNGVGALGKVEETDYDLVLMDIQMPEMDGFRATAEIRKDIRNKDLPIIATTAHAMVEHRKMSLGAGMNDHITKPIDSNELMLMLIKWIKPGKRKVDEALIAGNKEKKRQHDPMISDMPGISVRKGLARVGENVGLYKNLLGKFRRDYSTVDHEVRDALKNKDTGLARRLTHTIKGVSGNIGAEELNSIAALLESAISLERYDEIDDLYTKFSNAMKTVTDSLNSVLVQNEEKPALRNSSAEMTDLVELLELMLELEVCVNKREPRKCKGIMMKLTSSSWPDDYFKEVDDLSHFINKYKFKQSQPILESIIIKLKRDLGTHTLDAIRVIR